MSKETGNRKYQSTDQKLARYFIQRMLRANKALRRAKYAMKNNDPTINETGQVEEIEVFRIELENLVEFYYNRYEYIKKDKPGIMPDNPELDDYSFNELKKLYYEVIDMQERLGHTTIEGREYKKRSIGRDE